MHLLGDLTLVCMVMEVPESPSVVLNTPHHDLFTPSNMLNRFSHLPSPTPKLFRSVGSVPGRPVTVKSVVSLQSSEVSPAASHIWLEHWM